MTRYAILVLGAGSTLAKSQVAGFTRSDGAFVKEHDNGRGAGISAVAHPKGHKVGANVYFPHPQKPGKKALGKYAGQRNGKSVIQHSTGEHEVEHDQVKGASGVPKQADPVADRKGQAEHWASVAEKK